MTTGYITREAAIDLLRKTNGRIFTVGFYRRTDSTVTDQTAGELRVMNCRTGVTKGLKGGPAAYDPVSKGLLWVYDLKAPGPNQRRSINLRGLAWIKFQGMTWKVLQWT